MVLRAMQAAAAAAVLARLARGRDRLPPLATAVPRRSVSVVVPARDEEGRIAPCLDALREDPGVAEVIVVDDRSSDGTAALARALGARVVEGTELPAGWVGKPWALQQGLEAATGEVVVSLDADARPRRGLAGALDAALADADWVTCGPRFVCDTAGERWLHPSMLAGLVYRFGPSDVPRPGRVVANGQCTAAVRERLLAAGGYRFSAGHMTDDAAQARGLAREGWRVAFRDASGLLEVKMHDSARELWREWGRSLALPGIEPRAWQAADVAIVWLTMALPVLRLATRRAPDAALPVLLLARLRPLDLALLALRFALLFGLRGSYARRGAAFWLSPLADPATAACLTLAVLRPRREWRGRTYP
jgi:dolichol-phosphate mannosyltransferase